MCLGRYSFSLTDTSPTLRRRRYFTDVSVSNLSTLGHSDELQHGGQKPAETSVIKICYKSVKLLLEELINIKVILF